MTIWALVAILVPAQSLGQRSDITAMFMYESVADALNPEVVIQDKPPMAVATSNGLYRIELVWEPIEIKPNEIVSFHLKITNTLSNKPAENTHYDFAVLKDGQPIKDLRDSFALTGTAVHTVEFPSTGSFKVVVNVHGSDTIKRHNGSVSFDLKVVPEFPISTVIVMATLVGITIALTRFTILNKSTGNNIPHA